MCVGGFLYRTNKLQITLDVFIVEYIINLLSSNTITLVLLQLHYSCFNYFFACVFLSFVVDFFVVVVVFFFFSNRY